MYKGVIVRGYGYVKLPDGIYPTLSDFVETPNSKLTSSTHIYIYIYFKKSLLNLLNKWIKQTWK